MAGTRLYIQSLVLVELLVLVAWSFFHGLCQNGDPLCKISLRRYKQLELPSFESPHQLPLVQVGNHSLDNIPLKWSKNPDSGIVCSQPDSPLVRTQIFWWCPTMNPADPVSVVVRESSILVFSNESDLRGIAMPEIVSPFVLSVQLVLEETNGVAHKAQDLASTLQDTVRNLRNWPCVDQVQVEMSVVKPFTSQWIVSESTSEETDGAVPAYLPAPSEMQAEQLIESLDSGNLIGFDIILYVPALQPISTVSFQVGDSQLLMVGGWETHTVSDWLMGKMGIPVKQLDGDGSLPSWYDEWYWYQSSLKLSMDIQLLYSRVQHLVTEPLELGPSSNLREYYHSLKALEKHLQVTLKTSRIHSDFPPEQYAAIFAPLLFPLILPFLVGTIKEYKRFKEKKRSKREQEEKKEKVD
jgi:Phosphatidylinositol-glycan biosynthesis class S protein